MIEDYPRDKFLKWLKKERDMYALPRNQYRTYPDLIIQDIIDELEKNY